LQEKLEDLQKELQEKLEDMQEDITDIKLLEELKDV